MNVRDRWSLFQEVYSQHKLLFGIALLICTVLATGEWIVQFISQWIVIPKAGSIEFLGVPAPLWALILLGVVAAVAMVEYAVGLKEALTPKLGVTFNPRAEGIIRTPMWVTTGDGQVKRDEEAVFVSVTVNALSKTSVKNFIGFITKIEKKMEDGSSFIDIPVYGHIKLNDPGIVYPRVPSVLNVLRTSKTEGTLNFAAPWPLTLQDAFKDHGIYTITVEVNGDGVTETIKVEVVWNGKWDEIKARQAIE
jgi:hypothetical protein